MPQRSDEKVLAQCGVLVTRPAGRNTDLSAALQAYGAKVFEFPLLSIQACPVHRQLVASEGINPDWLIFTSRNAVEQAFSQWPQLASLTASTGFSAVGASTARALEANGVRRVLLPQDKYSSEGLLALAEFQNPAGQQIMILTGRDGRPLLVDTLRDRGAQVDCLEVYRRVPTSADFGGYLRRHNGLIQMIVITSAEAAEVLKNLAGEHQRSMVIGCPLVVASARIAVAAKSLGFNAPLEIALQVNDEALVEACLRLWRLICQ